MKDIRKEKSDKTIERILTAARKIFAEKGYNGAHVDEIAEAAGVNKATIYYQIGDKDTLYASVIHQVLGNTAQDIAAAVGRAGSLEEKLKAYINCIAANMDKNPDLPPIMMREVASGGQTLPRVVVEDIASVLTILFGILDEGRKKRVFIETVPFLIHIMIVGTIVFYKNAQPIKERQSWLPDKIKNYDKKLKGSLGDEVAALVLKAIKK